jgi:hypothetical protein
MIYQRPVLLQVELPVSFDLIGWWTANHNSSLRELRDFQWISQFIRRYNRSGDPFHYMMGVCLKINDSINGTIDSVQLVICVLTCGR